jgi:hypothetical protein
MVEMGKAVNVLHHASRSVKNLKEITEELLCPTADLVDGAVVFQNFLNSTAIAEPKEFGAPKEFPILADSPASTSGFTNKRMEVAFPLGTAARTKSDRPQASPVLSQIEGTYAVGTEQSKGDLGSIGGIGLHENPTHAGAGPISLEEARKREVITSKAR